MAHDERDRVAAAKVIAKESGESAEQVKVRLDSGEIPEAEMPSAAEIEHRQKTDEYNAAMRDYAPPFVQPDASGDYMFTEDDLIRYGMTDAEIIRLRREGAAAAGQLTEYDEEQEALSLQHRRAQVDRLAVIDGGPQIRAQLSEMERYFSGQAPNREGQYCKRYPYVSPTDEIVGINGYIFNIPKHRKVMLPTEVLVSLRAKAMAMQQFDVLSAIYAARQNRPLEYNNNADAYQATMRANHHVRLDLIPGNDAQYGVR